MNRELFVGLCSLYGNALLATACSEEDPLSNGSDQTDGSSDGNEDENGGDGESGGFKYNRLAC